MTISYYTKKDIKYFIDEENSFIKITSLKNPLKITGTRFGAILGKNPYKSPFQAWCEIFNLYEEKEFPKEKYWYNYFFDFLKDFFFGPNKVILIKLLERLLKEKLLLTLKMFFFQIQIIILLFQKKILLMIFFQNMLSLEVVGMLYYIIKNIKK